MNTKAPIIMIVEDETLLLQAITKKLTSVGITAISCESAGEALAHLEKKASFPDAIWLDYYLKDMNGLGFMKKLQEKKAWAEIPVIVVSNSASPESVNGMLALGAKKYILKAEHRMDDIIQTIRNIIDNAKKEANQKS